MSLGTDSKVCDRLVWTQSNVKYSGRGFRPLATTPASEMICSLFTSASKTHFSKNYFLDVFPILVVANDAFPIDGSISKRNHLQFRQRDNDLRQIGYIAAGCITTDRQRRRIQERNSEFGFIVCIVIQGAMNVDRFPILSNRLNHSDLKKSISTEIFDSDEFMSI